ncbi:RES family NAD+ phosphorylase [Cecembia calidifontis]|uniref:RES family NAD+ phosphorylase n=1 Tax=Cecembia calidifontis TaxID=1187080 RepID=UPI001029E0C9|nr:RES family NAD+ phosphorylase [Cecembia calidifontis]
MKYFRLIEKIPGRLPLGYGPGSGRWNPFGIPVIYACSHSALNFLELLSIKGPVVSLTAWSLVEFELAEDPPFLGVEDLPLDWSLRPHPKITQTIGAFWTKQQEHVALKVPSCRIPLINYPQEHNLLVNPLHPDFSNKIKFIQETNVSFSINPL